MAEKSGNGTRKEKGLSRSKGESKRRESKVN